MIYIYKDKIRSRGLFAYFWTVVDTFRYLQNTDSLFVDLTGIGPFYDPKYDRTHNVWEYYFEQPFKLDTTCYNKDHKLFIYNDSRILNFIFGIKNSHYQLSYDQESRNIAQNIILQHIRFQPHILNKINNFYIQHFINKKILGLHVRAGNMFIHGNANNFPQLMTAEYFYPYVDKELDKYDKLFLITNTLRIRESFKNRYADNLIYYETALLAEIDFDITWLHNDRNYDKGELAIVECVLLSLCNKMLVTGSNLGCLSTLLSNNEHEFIDQEVIYNY